MGQQVAGVIAKKSMPKPADGDNFNRAKALELLFSLPVPPQPDRDIRSRAGHTYPIHTPLGRIMRIKGFTIKKLTTMEGCPQVRVMRYYVSGEWEVSDRYRGALARALNVDPRIL